MANTNENDSPLVWPTDDITTGFIGTTPIVLSNGPDGKLHGFINKCSHCGSKMDRELLGNSRFHKCLYHGGTFDGVGDLKAALMAFRLWKTSRLAIA
ncbi:MAG: Rieske 2Fe-2S domain-containing protein [Rhodospirillaceae bacterium]|nr:Rieske 2Fe-2S domain-containing protein [Rhodospirillaceae bacterium]